MKNANKRENLKSDTHIGAFSEKALDALNGFYVYALVDPRNESVFYIGKGIGNRLFSHEIESEKEQKKERQKICKIREIENEGFSVKRLIVNWGLSEEEAFPSRSATACHGRMVVGRLPQG